MLDKKITSHVMLKKKKNSTTSKFVGLVLVQAGTLCHHGLPTLADFSTDSIQCIQISSSPTAVLACSELARCDANDLS